MKNKIRKIAKNWLPPAITRTIKKLNGQSSFGFFGNFPTWKEAQKNSTGYDTSTVLEKVRIGATKAKLGEVAFERDSVTFATPEYSWPLLASLLWISSQEGNQLNLMDFGGSLGSSYFQNKKMLAHLSKIQWSIVEQQNFVRTGKKEFEDNTLKFFESTEGCFKETSPNTALFSSVLQYIEKPYEILEKTIALNFKYIIFDRISFIPNGPDRITIQKVAPKIYDSSYPAWFFNKEKFIKFLADKYEYIAEWDALAGTIQLNDTVANDRGFIFKRK